MTRTPIQYEYPPFTLRSNLLFFHDWRYVHHGITRWTTATGEPIERYSDEPLPDVVEWRGSDIPSGIRLRAIPAQKSDPFLRADSPWEEHLRHATVIRDGGTYRLWYDTKSLGCYAESDDGTTWRKPKLGRREFEGNTANNILWGENLPPEPDYIGAGCVFIDPSAPAQERYKSFHNRHIDAEVFEEFRRRYPEDTSPRAQSGIERGKGTLAQAGATSPDGIHWTPFDLPLVVHGSDTQNVAYYDEVLGKYVGYFRTHVFRRRSIGRAETDDFRHFPLTPSSDAGIGPADVWSDELSGCARLPPHVLPKTSPRTGDGVLWSFRLIRLPTCGMGPGKRTYRTSYAPGRARLPPHALLFAGRWRVSEDRWSIHLATSPDWCPLELPGEAPLRIYLRIGLRDLREISDAEWDAGGSAVESPGMVELPGDRVGQQENGSPV